jgi:hypothetical protein
MEHKAMPRPTSASTADNPLPEVPEPLGRAAHDLAAGEQPPLYESRTPGGRIFYVVNLN